MPRISVLMSVLDCERYVEQAVRSILDQSYRDLELIVVDDGSRDQTAAILSRIVDRRLRIQRNEVCLGVGLSIARAYAHCSGEFIARMDADDVSYPMRLQRSIEILDHHPTLLLVSGSADRIFVETGTRIDNYYTKTFDFTPIASDLVQHASAVREKLVVDNIICQPTVTMRRSAIERVGFYRLPLVEDYDLWLRMSEAGAVAAVPEAWLLHRVHPRSTSNTRWLEMRRYEWVVRTAARRRRRQREEDLQGLLRRSHFSLGVLRFQAISLGNYLRQEGGVLATNGKMLWGASWKAIGYGVKIATEPASSCRAVARRIIAMAARR